MEGGQLLGACCLPGFLVPDHYAAFPLPLPLQLPSQPNDNRLFQMPFDQEEAENHGGMLYSDQCGLYPLPAFGSCSAAAGATAKPTAGFMPSTIGAETKVR
jgi:hypothetical protein